MVPQRDKKQPKAIGNCFLEVCECRFVNIYPVSELDACSTENARTLTYWACGTWLCGICPHLSSWVSMIFIFLNFHIARLLFFFLIKGHSKECLTTHIPQENNCHTKDGQKYKTASVKNKSTLKTKLVVLFLRSSTTKLQDRIKEIA